MLRLIKNWLADKLLHVTLCYSIGITILMLMPIPDSDLDVPFSDKLAHFGVYALLSLLWLLVAIKRRGMNITTFLWVFFVLFAYGMVIEVIQGNFIDSRSFDVWDIVANSVGIVLGMTVYHFGKKKDWI